MSRAGKKHRRGETGASGQQTWSAKRRRKSRDLGQNFLRKRSVARRIVAGAGIGEKDLVVEFGAGSGMLTREISARARRVIAVEIDPFWARRLPALTEGPGNVEVVEGDARRISLPGEPFRVVANLPFGITTDVLSRLLDDPDLPLIGACLIVQKQLALKHARPRPTTLKTLSWSPWWRFGLGPRVPAWDFDPVPTVDARVLTVERREPPLVEARRRREFLRFTRLMFEAPGGAVGKALRRCSSRRKVAELARRHGFSPDDRPTTLTVEQWAGLFRELSKTA